MLTLLFLICMLGIFGKLLIFGLRAAWGVSKLILTVVFFPVILIGMVFAGLIYLAFPILIIVGIVTLLSRNKKQEKRVNVQKRGDAYEDKI